MKLIDGSPVYFLIDYNKSLILQSSEGQVEGMDAQVVKQAVLQAINNVQAE